MIIEKYGEICLFGDDEIAIKDFTFNCESDKLCLNVAIRKVLYFASGIIDRNLKVLEGEHEDYEP